MAVLSRRAFLMTGSCVTAGLFLDGAPPAYALRARSAMTPAHLLPDPIAPDVLYTVAQAAMDAARGAGATYADIRAGQQYRIGGDELGASLSYGVRVLVDGTWSFAHGHTLTTDAVANAVRNAVARSRAYRAYASSAEAATVLAPAPVVTGTWVAPLAIDPFAVPLQDQEDRVGALTAALTRVAGTFAPFTAFGVSWVRDTVVFASSEGSLTTQRITRGQPGVVITTTRKWQSHPLVIPAQQRGFEMLLDPALEERLKALAEEAVEVSTLPVRRIDVGRYPVILDGLTMASLVSNTLGAGLELDRVLKYEADGIGTSYLAPLETMLGTQVTAPLVTLSMDRASPSLGAAQWDDEGVVPRSVPLIERGQLVDYITTRATAPALAHWYAAQHKPVRSNGAAVASVPGRVPMAVASQLRLTPTANTASLDQLIRDVPRGILARESWVATDQQLAGGQIRHNSFLFGIERGRVTHLIPYAALQFRTAKLWNSLRALGDETTATEQKMTLYKDQPPQAFAQTVHTPAGFFPSVDTITTDIKL